MDSTRITALKAWSDDVDETISAFLVGSIPPGHRTSELQRLLKDRRNILENSQAPAPHGHEHQHG